MGQRTTLSRQLALVTGAMLLVCASARAGAMLDVDVGWGGVVRTGAWTPVYVTASEDGAGIRPAVAEAVIPYDRTRALRLHQAFTLRSDPQTFILYLPDPDPLEDAAIVLRDLHSRAKLAEAALQPIASDRPRVYAISDSDILVGLAGDAPSLQHLLKRGYRTDLYLGRIPPLRLPDQVIGYQSLSILVLSAPDLLALSPAQQQAIVQWVRGGGALIFWPGQGLVPAEAPIASILPCEIGSAEDLQFTAEDNKALGLARRITSLPARKVTPRPGATRSPVLAGRSEAWVRQAGLGTVVLLPFDASRLDFAAEEEPADAAWGSILSLAHPIKKPKDDARLPPDPGAYPYRQDPADTIVDRLGNVPGVGAFDFTYVAIVLLAMMVAVGPIDWFVLKRLGRQPWTWATTAGWGGLVTLGAISLGHILRSGDLHLRTLRIVDQADGQVVAATDYLGLYSPRTQRYELECPPQTWWRPMSYRALAGSDIDFQQRRDGTTPMPMTVNVWNLRFLQAEVADLSGQKPLLAAKLRMAYVAGKVHLQGTLTNLSSMHFEAVRLNASAGSANGPALPPGQTIKVDLALVNRSHETDRYNARVDPTRGSEAPVDLIEAAQGINVPRHRLIDRMIGARGLTAEELVCITAEASVPGGSVRLKGRTAVEQHWQVVRALVELER